VSELALFLVRIGFVAVLWIFVLSLLSVVGASFKNRRVMSRLAKQSGPQLSQAPVPELDIDDGDAFEPTKVQMLTGRSAGNSLELGEKKEVTIGRSPGSDLVISDEFASNTHAKLVLVGDEWVLQDLSSTNGTFIDGKRVTTPVTMTAGATIRIGTTTFDLRS